MIRAKRPFLFTMVACAAAFAAAPAAAADTATGGGGSASRWVATWTSAPIVPGRDKTIDGIFGGYHGLAFENQTVRNIAHTSVGGRRVRVRVSNAFGRDPLRIGAVHVALRQANSSIQPGTSRRLTFGGQAGITVPVGSVVVTDSAELDVPPASDLAVSVYLPVATGDATYHETTLKSSYVTLTPGNYTNAVDLPGAIATFSTFFVTAVEVLPHDPVGVLVVFGDSIAQGAGSSENLDRTWPDRLSARLNSNPNRPRLSVVNQGVGCGRLLWDFCGPKGVERFDRDVLGVAGVTGVVIHLGLNDINIPSILPNFGFPDFARESVSAAEITTGLHQLALRARAAGLKVYGATIVPYGASPIDGAFTPENEAKRQAVNRWVRTSGLFDGIIDFDAILLDPNDPTRTKPLPRYSSPRDGIHLTDEGYQAVANAINLAMLF